jgi:hypothetical protein
MDVIVIFIPELKGTKKQRKDWLLKTYGSGVVNSGHVLFLNKSTKSTK